MTCRSIASLLLAAATLACGSPSAPARVETAAWTMEVRLDPAASRLGPNRMEIQLADAAGAPIEGAQLEVRVHMHAMGAMPAMGGPARVRERVGGRYEAVFDLDMASTWQVEIAARASGRPPVHAAGSLTVGTPGLMLSGAVHGTEQAAAGQAAGHPAEFSWPASGLQQSGVRSAPAELRVFRRGIRALGVVASDERTLVDVSLKVGGWVRSLRADVLGAHVERGQVLFSLYSPELYAAQEELLQALASQARARGSAVPERADWRVRAARHRLALFDVAPAELEALVARGTPLEELPIRSPATGTLIEKDVVAGSAVEPGMRLLRIAPLERVWIDAEVYEADAPRLAGDLVARIELPYLPGRSFSGRVDGVYPALDPAARTLRVRVVVENSDLALRPGMWANVVLEGPGEERLAVPESAVLHAGSRHFVFVEGGEGRFRPRPVELGARSAGAVEVLSGLAPGERVVVSGTFLIASESRLRAALERW